MKPEKFVSIWLILSLICVIGLQIALIEVSHGSKLCDLKIDRVTPDKGAFTVSNIGTYPNKRTKALIWIKYENGTIYKNLVDVKAILPGKSVYYKNKFVINGPVKNALIRVNPYKSQRELNFNNNIIFFKKTPPVSFISGNLSPVNFSQNIVATEFYADGQWSSYCRGRGFTNYTPVISYPKTHWTNGKINGTESIKRIHVSLYLGNTISKISLKLRYEPLLVVKLNSGLGQEVELPWNSSSQAYELNQDLNVSNPYIICLNLAPGLNDISPLNRQCFYVNQTIFVYNKTMTVIPGYNIKSWKFS